VKRVKSLCLDAKVHLFRGYAKDTQLRDSYSDLVVVSKCFEGVDLWKRCPTLRRLAGQY